MNTNSYSYTKDLNQLSTVRRLQGTTSTLNPNSSVLHTSIH